jgi:pilus assembly protein CpaC
MWFIALLFSYQISAETLWLKVGEVRSLPAPPEAVVRVGARGIVRVVEDGARIQLVGLKPGITPVVIDKRSVMVTVSRASSKDFYQRFREAISRMKGLKLAADVHPIEVSGTLLRFSDWQRLAELSRQMQGEYSFKAHAHPAVAPQALAYFQKLARERGLPVLRFSASPQFTAHIPKAQKGLREATTEILSSFGIAVSASEGILAVEPLVRTQVILAEVNRSDSQTLGIEWPASYQANLIPKFAATQDLGVTLKALESRGQAQILASPNLLCRSGGEARFHAGGEFPIRLISKMSRDVVWKQHGVVLNVRPKADFQGALSIEIETEVSLLDMGNAVDGIPALKTNKVKSHFDLPGKRTIALSGLLRQELGDSVSGLPLLSRIPVLGRLFSSRQYQTHQSELVIFVTPEIHTPATDATLEMPKGWISHEW